MENLKKSMKKIMAISLAALMLGGGAVTVLPAVTESGIAASAASEGTTAGGFKWKRNDNGGVTITDYTGKRGNVVIPDRIGGKTVTEIGWYAFEDCTGLTSVTIPDSVTTIADGAFSDCTGLTSVTIPDRVMDINNGAFVGCTGLTSINVNKDNKNFTSDNGVLFNKDKSILEMYPEGKKGAYTISDSVTRIGSCAFRGCNGLTSVTIPDSVTNIDDFAFFRCNGLTSITIPDSVTEIGYRAFLNCTELRSVDMPDSVTKIDVWTFSGCTSLTSITIPDSVTTIADGAFSDCTGLTSITIPDSVTNIGRTVFSGCTGLKSVIIPESVTKIDDCMFSGCTDLTSITIPDSVTNIGRVVFSGCTDLTISGKTGSEAETYAKRNNIPFVSIVEVTGVKLNKTSLSLEKGKTTAIKATVNPSNATNKSVTWTSSDTKVATVSDGTVKAVAAGTAKITAKTNNSKTATCKVTVKNPVINATGVKLNKTSLELEKGKSEKLTATIIPSNASNKNVTWISSDTKVATVSNGTVEAVSAGTAIITVLTANGKMTKCEVKVSQTGIGIMIVLAVFAVLVLGAAIIIFIRRKRRKNN